MKVLHPTKQIYPPMHALRTLDAFARLGTVWEVKARGGYYLLRHGQKRPSLAINAFTRWLRSLFTS